MLKSPLLSGASLMPIVLGFDAEAPASGGDAPPATPPSEGAGGSLMTEGGSDAATENAGVPVDAPADGVADDAKPNVEGDKPDAAEEGDDNDDKPEGAPEEYADFEFAEGVQLDSEALDELKTIAKELNLPQGEAQRIASLAEKMSVKWSEQLQNHITETRTSWRAAVTSDKEIGGDKLQENLSVAKSAIETFGSPELKKMLDDTGIGDNPEFIRFAYRIGKANSEHDFAKSGKPTQEVSFYDHPTSKPRT